MTIPRITLNSSSHTIPVLGLSTGSFPPVGSEAVKLAVLQAIELGVRHFDTGALYGTEQPVGEAVAEAFSLGLIKSRDELFISSKLWINDAHGELVLSALRKTLENLMLDHLDLYLIHWPVSLKPGPFEWPIRKENLLPMDFKSVWAAMEECQRLGLTKSIGVSNFSCKKLGDILATAKIPPAVCQVEMNPMWQQKKLINFCEANGIIVAAYYPQGFPPACNKVMECEVLKEIAKAKGKTLAQVCLIWAYEQGAVVVMKGFHKESMKQNLEIFDWELSAEESKKISEIPQNRGNPGVGFVSESGPFKSVEELWDEEP